MTTNETAAATETKTETVPAGAAPKTEKAPKVKTEKAPKAKTEKTAKAKDAPKGETASKGETESKGEDAPKASKAKTEGVKAAYSEAMGIGGEDKPDVIAGIPVHPLANVFPMMKNEEFDALVESIGKAPDRMSNERPILFEGQLLDGRNRAAAMAKLGISPTKIRNHCDEFHGDPIKFVIDANVRRRHLTPGQRAAVAYDTLKAMGIRKGRPAKGEKRPTMKDVAAQTGTNPRNVQRLAAIEKADPAAAAAVRAGKDELGTAEKKAKHLTKAEREKLASDEAAKKANERAAKAAKKNAPAADVGAAGAEVVSIVSTPMNKDGSLNVRSILSALRCLSDLGGMLGDKITPKTILETVGAGLDVREFYGEVSGAAGLLQKLRQATI